MTLSERRGAVAERIKALQSARDQLRVEAQRIDAQLLQLTGQLQLLDELLRTPESDATEVPTAS